MDMLDPQRETGSIELNLKVISCRHTKFCKRSFRQDGIYSDFYDYV